MENEKRLYQMDNLELADLLALEPERIDEVIEMLVEDDEISRLRQIAEFLEGEKVPEEEIGDYRYNKKINQTLSRIYEFDSVFYPEDDDILYDDIIDENEELEDIYSEHPEWDDRPYSQIPEGMNIDEYSKAIEDGYIFNDEDMNIFEANLILNDRIEAELLLLKYQAQKESLKTELKEIELKMDEMENEINRTGSSGFEPEYEELYELFDKRSQIESELSKLERRISSFESAIEADKWQERSYAELDKKETELASLEAEEKTISEAEALINKQNQKEGQDIGED